MQGHGGRPLRPAHGTGGAWGGNVDPLGHLSQVNDMVPIPDKALLAADLSFHAVLGNHDIRRAAGTPDQGAGEILIARLQRQPSACTASPRSPLAG